MMNRKMPVLLLTGYLGSGKTTLVNHILANRKGIRFAVIVNDIGEVNIDADLIQKGGVVDQKDDSLVALQNGCICCTLQTDLIKQIEDLMAMDKFDYIVIEASGICEPEPIAQTIVNIPSLGVDFVKSGVPVLDCIVTVVDALRMRDEFECGDTLKWDNIEEEDIENLVIQQIEFCDIVLLNKASEVAPEELARVRKIVSELNPGAEIIECDFADVELDKLLNTGKFNYRFTEGNAGWIRHLEAPVPEDDDDDEDEHDEHHHDEDEDHHNREHHHHDEDEDHQNGHHHHHHHHEGGEVEEYGIGTFVYFRRRPFDMNRFDWFVAKRLPKNVIRVKGLCWFSDNPDMSYLFEQAGRQLQLREAGMWYVAAPEEELRNLAQADPSILRDWDAEYGDRMQKLVFIGRNIDKDALIADLDSCLCN
ncbi:MAG: CobW family GTP-binding protein [Candidatus Cryptobacteroides sp.]